MKNQNLKIIIIVSIVIISNESVVVRDFLEPITQESISRGVDHTDSKDLITTIPFIKDNEFRYDWLLPNSLQDFTWLIYSLIIIFIITAVSNGANITDGLDGLAAQVFMGDTGSLSIGAIIAVLAILVKKELLIPVLCGIFLIENLSVIIQVLYFKHTKKKYGEGKRLFLMAPLHHHYQKKGIHETKIVARFWMIGILLAILTLATLKLR